VITLAEPTTAVTDYVLAGLSGVFAWSLFRGRDGQRARTLWATAFAALSVTALIGGTYHGFEITTLWPATVTVAGVTAFAMVAGSAMATTTGRVRATIIGIAALKLVVYLAWTSRHDDFAAVIVDSGLALLAVAALHGSSALMGRDAGARAMLTAVVLSLAGAGMQASGIGLPRHFNHNDLFHVVQLAATAAFHRGARVLRDRPERVVPFPAQGQ
jgi:uncharacterized protein DUF6962